MTSAATATKDRTMAGVTPEQAAEALSAAGADVIVVAAHTGLDETYGYGREENFAKYLANEVPGIDVILAGHSHATIEGKLINGVLVTEPGSGATRVSNIKISLSGSGSDWTVSTKTSKTESVSALAEDPALLADLMPYHDTTVTYINTKVGTATAEFPGGFIGRVTDSAIGDLINKVQMDAATAAGYPVFHEPAGSGGLRLATGLDRAGACSPQPAWFSI